MRGQQGVTHRHRNEVGLCQAGSLKLHQDAALLLYTFSVGLLCDFDRNLPLARCSWSSALHSVERKWRTAKNNLPGFHCCEIFVQNITVGCWQAIAAKCRTDGQKSLASGMIGLNEVQ